ncbi:hypothetical protein CK203_006982 [Vitis vinifera]|uniref:F-box domain-containing protein n=1 Tax=Vitis vinifera TaxID=29760 RepID=A0A438KC72_VITVI|nr:hypothetical protein CK203_006982 [Vitis vinifera]
MAMREESGKPDPDPPEEQESWLWSVLPQDLLRLIVERLSLVDLIRLRAVCKDWLLAPIHDLQPIHNLPWIMNHWFTLTSRLCLLFEPFRRLPYVIEDTHVIPGKMGLPPGSTELPAATVCASRSGWVLFTEGLEYCLFRRVVKDMASNVRVTLYRKAPEHQTLFRDFAATFSSIPTSPDCVFFVSHPSTSDQIFTSTHSIGINHGRLIPLPVPMRRVILLRVWFTWKAVFIVLAKGDYWHPSISLPKSGGRWFDWLDRVWVKMESLEGGAIFLGNPCFGVSAGEKTKMVANRVYYFLWHTPTFITYGPVSPGIGSASEERIVYPDTWDPDRLYGDSNWIDPPLLQPWQG